MLYLDTVREAAQKGNEMATTVDKMTVWENLKWELSVEVEHDPNYNLHKPFVTVWFGMVEMDPSVNCLAIWDAINQEIQANGGEWFGDEERHGWYYVSYLNIGANVVVDILRRFVGERGRHMYHYPNGQSAIEWYAARKTKEWGNV